MPSVFKKLLCCCTALLLAFAALGSVPARGSASPEGARQGKVQIKPISELRIGDEVLAFAEWKDKGNDPGLDQRLSYEKVLDVIASHREQRLVHITLETGEKLTATDGHPFKTAEGWRDAIMLKKGGKLLLKGAGEDDDDAAEYSEEGERIVTIADIQIEQKAIPVYNLEVANAHTFFVGEDGVLVHNASKPCPIKPKKPKYDVSNNEDPLLALESIEIAQRRKGRNAIESIEKSKQRAEYNLKRYKYTPEE
jgi:intein/homing endonuclease